MQSDLTVGTAFVPANGTTVTLRECGKCGSVYSFAPAHDDASNGSIQTIAHQTA